MSDSFMQLRCKAGDIAFIINDEVGCESNVGRLVKVIGNLQITEFGEPEWCIKPLHDESWHVLTRKGIQIDLKPFSMRIGHQDSWLLPIRFDEVEASLIATNSSTRLEVADEVY